MLIWRLLWSRICIYVFNSSKEVIRGSVSTLISLSLWFHSDTSMNLYTTQNRNWLCPAKTNIASGFVENLNKRNIMLYSPLPFLIPYGPRIGIFMCLWNNAKAETTQSLWYDKHIRIEKYKLNKSLFYANVASHFSYTAIVTGAHSFFGPHLGGCWTMQKKKQWAWDKVMNGIRIVGRLLLPADVDAYAEEVMAQCTRTNSPIVTIYTSAAFCCLAVGVDESPSKRRCSFIRREFIQKDSIQT